LWLGQRQKQIRQYIGFCRFFAMISKGQKGDHVKGQIEHIDGIPPTSAASARRVAQLRVASQKKTARNGVTRISTQPTETKTSFMSGAAGEDAWEFYLRITVVNSGAG
jgi:hypothetical protein